MHFVDAIFIFYVAMTCTESLIRNFSEPLDGSKLLEERVRYESWKENTQKSCTFVPKAAFFQVSNKMEEM